MTAGEAPTSGRVVEHAGARRPDPTWGLLYRAGGCSALLYVLLALGLCEFSMHPSQLLHVRDRLATLDHSVLRAHAPRILRSRTHEEAEALLASITG